MIWIVSPLFLRIVGLVFNASAITVWPLVISRDEVRSETLVVHEEIHGKQAGESFLLLGALLSVLCVATSAPAWTFLAGLACVYAVHAVLYYGFWAVGYVTARRYYTEARYAESKFAARGFSRADVIWLAAYRVNPLEREAFGNEVDQLYLGTRRPFAWIRYVRGAWDYDREWRRDPPIGELS